MRFVMFVCALTLAFQLAAWGAPPENVKQLKQSAHSAISARNFDRAIDDLLKARKMAPKDSSIDKELSRAYFERGKAAQNHPQQALDDLCQAYFYSDNNREVALLRARLIFALRKNPDKFDDLKQLGDSAVARGQKEAAIVHYSQALGLSTNAELMQARSKILKELGLSFWPPVDTKTDYNAYMMTAQRWIRSVWLPPRGKNSSRVTVRFHVVKDGRIKRPRVHQTSGDSETDGAALKALELVSPLRRLPDGPDDEVDIEFTFDYNNLSGDKQIRGQLLEGISFYEKGESEFLKGNYSEAIPYLEKSVAAASSKRCYLFNDRLIDALLAAGDAQGGDPCKALPYYQRALNLDATYDPSMAKWEKALGNMGVDSSSDEAVIAFAKKLEGAGDFQGALAAYRALINRGNKRTDVSERVSALDKRISSEGISKRWRDHIERNPNSVEGHLGLALSLKDAGDVDGALKEFAKVLELDAQNASAKENIQKLTPTEAKQP